jgi:hypothetical protein
MAARRPALGTLSGLVLGAAIATGLRFLWDLYWYSRTPREEQDEIVDGVPGLIGGESNQWPRTI